MLIYVVLTYVKAIEEVKTVTSGRKVGDETILTTENRGWFVSFEGSWEKVFLGFEKPDLKVGQPVKIRIETQ